MCSFVALVTLVLFQILWLFFFLPFWIFTLRGGTEFFVWSFIGVKATIIRREDVCNALSRCLDLIFFVSHVR